MTMNFSVMCMLSQLANRWAVMHVLCLLRRARPAPSVSIRETAQPVYSGVTMRWYVRLAMRVCH